MRLPDRAPRSFLRLSAGLLGVALVSACAPLRAPVVQPAQQPSASKPAEPSGPVGDPSLPVAGPEAGPAPLTPIVAAERPPEPETDVLESGDEVSAEESPPTPSPLDELAEIGPELPRGGLEQERAALGSKPIEFDIPVELNDTVLGWVDFFTTRYREKFLRGLIRSGRYLPMIWDIFRAEGLPLDLAYLVHVESAYQPEALSRARARGLFQFIASTARRYGLRVDGWVDERVDPEKATRAAAAYLKDLYAMFGDWHLALAAYNAGEGKVQRSLSRTGAADFWSLSGTSALSRETRSYVPAILAATVISKDPTRFGFEFEPDPPLEYDTIRVEGAADLRVLARCAGVDFETMRALNPALRRLQTPPDGVTEVRVPRGSAEKTLAALERIPPGSRVLVTYHRVKRGDTLAAIAKRYGVSVAAIQRANGLGPKRLLRVGQVLKIPSGGGAFAYERRDSGRGPTARGDTLIYRVQPGDTLSGIARRHGSSVEAIARASGIRANSILRVGQRLRIPAVRAANGAPADPRTAQHPRATHTVRRGETLWRIATLYGMSVAELCALNGIREDAVLVPGTKLAVATD